MTEQLKDDKIKIPLKTEENLIDSMTEKQKRYCQKIEKQIDEGRKLNEFIDPDEDDTEGDLESGTDEEEQNEDLESDSVYREQEENDYLRSMSNEELTNTKKRLAEYTLENYKDIHFYIKKVNEYRKLADKKQEAIMKKAKLISKIDTLLNVNQKSKNPVDKLCSE